MSSVKTRPHYTVKEAYIVMRKIILLLLFTAILIISGQVIQCEAGSLNWNAEWIGLSEENNPNTWLAYRKQIIVDKKVKKAEAFIACDSKYWLWINGNLVVFEGQLKRGPSPTTTYYDVIDLSSHLQKGKNTIAILVWYFGKHGFSHNDSKKSGLIFQALINNKQILSDRSWKVKIHPAFKTAGPPHPNYRLPEPNILFNAGKDIPGWMNPDYQDDAWNDADQFGKPPVKPWGELYIRPILQWKDYGLNKYVSQSQKTTKDGKQKIIAKLPYNCQVTPYLKIKSPAGKKIDIRTDHYFIRKTSSIRNVYITKKGIQEYEAFGWINGHEVHYTIPKEVEVLSLKYRETGYNAEFIGSFNCNDKALNILWKKAKRTLYVTMRDTYMDCPDRERAQWWGDAVNELGEAFYVFDAKNGPLLAKKGMYELARWQRPDKTLYSPVPCGHMPDDADRAINIRKTKIKDGRWNRELPRQMLASVGWYGFWTYYIYTGDKETIKDVYPAVRDYLSIWKLGEDGLIIHRPGEWDWTDWGQNKDVPIIENAWVYLALKACVEMALLTGNNKDIADYKRKMESIEDNYNKTFWQGDKYRSLSHKGETDDRANAMPIIANLALPEYYPAIIKVLEKEFHASPYMEKYVLESLYLMNKPFKGIARMKKLFDRMIRSPYSTLPEHFGSNKKRGKGKKIVWGAGTFNHAWSGGPLTLLSQYAAGVAPITPGFSSFSVKPQMGPLENIETVVPVPQGLIKLKLINEEKLFTIDLDKPDGTKAFVYIPVEGKKVKEIKINNKVFWKEDSIKNKIKGVRYIKKTKDRISLEIDQKKSLIKTVYY